MKWTDAMREQAASLYGERWRELGEEEFWPNFEAIKREIHAVVEGEELPPELLSQADAAHERRMLRERYQAHKDLGLNQTPSGQWE